MAKPTPGPWHWHSCGGYYVLCNDTVTQQGDYPNGIITDDGSACGEYTPSIDVDGPDARLIACAPDLLEVCKIALPFLEANCIGADRPRIVREAIEKAEGGRG